MLYFVFCCYLYVSSSGLTSSLGEERADFSASDYS